MAKYKKRDDGCNQKSAVGGKKPNGKYIKKSVHGKTQKELEANINALTNEINSGVAVWQSDITFSQLAQIWIPARPPGLFFDFFAGDRSSRKVSSRTWCRRVSMGL